MENLTIAEKIILNHSNLYFQFNKMSKQYNRDVLNLLRDVMEPIDLINIDELTEDNRVQVVRYIKFYQIDMKYIFLLCILYKKLHLVSQYSEELFSYFNIINNKDVIIRILAGHRGKESYVKLYSYIKYFSQSANPYMPHLDFTNNYVGKFNGKDMNKFMLEKYIKENGEEPPIQYTLNLFDFHAFDGTNDSFYIIKNEEMEKNIITLNDKYFLSNKMNDAYYIINSDDEKYIKDVASQGLNKHSLKYF